MARRRSRRSNLLIVAAILIAACSAEEPAAPVRQDPVVVYASFPDQEFLTGLFRRFTDDTGTIVIVRHGGREKTVDDVIADNIEPPADVILTQSVRGVSRAADKGALRPLPGDLVGAGIPASLRDNDGFWVAYSYRVPVIVYDSRMRDMELPRSVEDLGSDQFRGRLCLSSSDNLVNRTVIATLIERLGVRPAEVQVRGWVANLATTPFDHERQLLDAIEQGRCAIGMASSRAYLAAMASNADMSVKGAAVSNAGTDVEAAGINRHARNPEGAARLIAWMLDDEFQHDYSMQTMSSPASNSVDDRMADLVGFDRQLVSGGAAVAWHDEAAVLLAERARYP